VINYNWIKHQFRKKTRVYILPTRMGAYLNGLIFLMFLLSIGYSNNLLLIFTLFLFGFNLLWVIQSHFHLHPLKFEGLSLANGHCGEALPFKILWARVPNAPMKWDLTLETKNESVPLEVFESTKNYSLGEVCLSGRGKWQWKYLKVSSEMPFGLYRVWCFYPLIDQTIAYPKRLKNDFKLVVSGEHREGQCETGRRGQEDIWELAPYQGEEARKISWKHYARTGNILIKEGEELNDAIYKIELKLPSDLNAREVYLSQLASEMVFCHRQNVPFYFKTPHGQWGPSSEGVHLHECLKVLALC